MISKEQIKALRTCVSRAGLDEPAYRLMLRNLADVASCKDLSQIGYEDCMAFLEDQGGSTEMRWRTIVATRGTLAGTRMVHKINELFADYERLAEALGVPEPRRYKRPGLVENASAGRTNSPSGLRKHEAWRLIETLKGIIERHQPRALTTEVTGGIPCRINAN